MTKKALGKGLKAFMPEEFGIIKEERFLEMDIDQLKPNPLQPRMRQNPESLDELAQSIRETGVLQPVVVVPEEGTYKIIVGERRWRAAKMAGLQKIPVLIRTLSKEQQHEVSLIENLQRDDLNPLELALAYQKMTQEFGLTQQDIADRVGKDRTSVANTLRLLKLPQEVQDLIAGLPHDVLTSITRSQGTRSGKLNELLATLELTKYDRLFYLGDPIDFVGINYNEGVDFIEVKSGRARFTEDEIKLKDLIECKMVNYVPLTVRRINIAEEMNTENNGLPEGD